MLNFHPNGAQTLTRWTDNPQKKVRVSVHCSYATVRVGLDQDKQLLAQTLYSGASKALQKKRQQQKEQQWNLKRLKNGIYIYFMY